MIFDALNLDSELNAERVRHHETGHALANWSLGLGVERVHAGPTSGVTEPRLKAEAVLSELTEEAALRAWTIVAMAGGCAQRRWLPSCYWFGCEDDDASVNQNLARLAVITGCDCRQELLAETDSLIERHWSRIELLVDSLRARDTLGGIAVEQLFASI